MRVRAALAATALAAAAVLGSAGAAVADDDLLAVNQEKVAEVNLICNLMIAAVQKDQPQCGATEGEIEDEDAAVTVQ